MIAGMMTSAMARPRAMRQTGRVRPSLLLLGGLAMLAAPACNGRLNLGSSILWSAKHETGDLSEWALAGKGGSEAQGAETAVAISTDFAHSGRYSVKLTNGAVSTYEDAHLWRQDDYPALAYYSAWFYLPRAYQTTADWSIIEFQVPDADDAGDIGLLLDIDQRSLPNGDLILSLYDHRFQVEVLYHNAFDASGELAVWMNGQLNYDVHRPISPNSTVYWTVCSKTEGLSPAESTIYVDDAAVSLARVTPTGDI
jgi:hypothetical protein